MWREVSHSAAAGACDAACCFCTLVFPLAFLPLHMGCSWPSPAVLVLRGATSYIFTELNILLNTWESRHRESRSVYQASSPYLSGVLAYENQDSHLLPSVWVSVTTWCPSVLKEILWGHPSMTPVENQSLRQTLTQTCTVLLSFPFY